MRKKNLGGRVRRNFFPSEASEAGDFSLRVEGTLFLLFFFIVRSFGKNAAAKFFSYPMKKIFFFLKKIFLNFAQAKKLLWGGRVRRNFFPSEASEAGDFSLRVEGNNYYIFLLYAPSVRMQLPNSFPTQ